VPQPDVMILLIASLVVATLANLWKQFRMNTQNELSPGEARTPNADVAKRSPMFLPAYWVREPSVPCQLLGPRRRKPVAGDWKKLAVRSAAVAIARWPLAFGAGLYRLSLWCFTLIDEFNESAIWSAIRWRAWLCMACSCEFASKG
jgi:hypothetical protein